MKSTRMSRSETTDFSIARLLAKDHSATASDASPSRTRTRDELVDSKNARTEYVPGKCDSTSCSPPNARYRRDTGEQQGFQPERDLSDGADHSFSSRSHEPVQCPKVHDLPWLRYTRYRPPKIPRRPLTENSSKRRPGSHARIPFTSQQLRTLEDKYKKSAYLSRRDVLELAGALRLPQNRVKVWFQNRRARDRRELHSVRKK